MTLLSNYDSLWKAFVRPYRQTYNEYDLGPTTFLIDSTTIRRTDLILKNKRGLPLKCSHYEPFNLKTKQTEPAPCVVYLHCNTGCRLEAKPAVDLLLPLGISVFCFDFSGCGLSGGEYITLGWFEKEDLETVLKHLKSNQKVQKLALWGRSMGAVTALLHSERDSHLISGLVLDSPFSNLMKLAEDVAISKTKLPSLVIKGALALIKQTIFKTTKLNMTNLSLEKLVERVNIPALFAASKDDTFVKFWHIETLFKGYKGDKRLVHITGDHNEMRERPFMEEVGDFFVRVLQIKKKNVAVSDKENKENSPFISNTQPNLLPVPPLTLKTLPEGHKEKVPLARIDLINNDDNGNNFMENFSQSLKNISEKDFLLFFTTKNSLSTEENTMRDRAITHDGKLESQEYRSKNESPCFFENCKDNDIPNERAERSISALNDYTMFYTKGLGSLNTTDIEGFFTQNKGNNTSTTHESSNNTEGSNQNTGLKNASIDESMLEDEGSPGIEKKYRMITKTSHREMVKSFNFDKGRVALPKPKPKEIGGFKGGLTKKLMNMKVVRSQIKEIGE